jgi:uncharacterized membrane protein YgdD (TMEM256/DUF423 family)
MQKKLVAMAASSAAIAVILGAMGAHALAKKVEEGLMTVKNLADFDTAVKYQMYHSLAIVMLALMWDHLPLKMAKGVAWLFVGGILLFSGSIYLLSTSNLLGISSWKSVLGPITPIGGLCFISGWLLLAYSALKK